MEDYVDGETNEQLLRTPIIFNSVMLIALPVIQVEALPNVFVLQQMTEEDRRLLDDFFLSKVSPETYEISFFESVESDNGRVDHMLHPNVNLPRSFLGRVNLSEDPNPTSFESRAFISSSDDELLIRAKPIQEEHPKFLELVQSAAKTNSGGYVLHLDGWTDGEVRRIWMAVKFTDTASTHEMPSYINRILTTGPVLSNPMSSAPPLVLREDVTQVIPVGEPGVFSALVIRQNPDTLYRDPTAITPGPRNLTREQALNRIETADAWTLGTLVELDRKGTLPEDVLERAGGLEVDLAKRFNLLQVEIKASGGFKSLPALYDLPTGPERKPDKEYTYNWSIPAHQLVTNPTNDLYSYEAEPFIYAAINKIMNIRVSFRDILGYSPELENTFQETLRGAYFDPLSSILSMSGLRVGHSVNAQNGNLEIKLRFVPESIVDTKSSNGAAQIPANNGDAINSEEKRVLSIRAAYSRAMQQLRDRNTVFSVESTLGLQTDTGETVRRVPISDDQRKTLYDDLKLCRNALDRLYRNDSVDPFALNSVILPQVGMLPVDGVVKYDVRWCVNRDPSLSWPDIREMPRSKVISISAEIPLLETLAQPAILAARELATAIASAFKVNSKPKLRLAYTRDGRNEEVLYIIDERLVDISLPNNRLSPAFAAIKPLSTKPFAKSGALIWNWAEHQAKPTSQTLENDWSKTEISGFDQDTALHELLRDIDLVLSPGQVDALWASSEANASLLDDLLHSKAEIAISTPSRIISILDSIDDQAMITSSADSIQRNMENSFKKRLGRVADVDTILAVPLTYANIGNKDQFLLYGSIKSTMLTLHLVSLTKVDEIPINGDSLLIIALVENTFYIRIFDTTGRIVVDKAESEITSEHFEHLKKLRKLLEKFVDNGQLSSEEEQNTLMLASFVTNYSSTALDQNTANFFPVALKRNGEQNSLVIQFDARQPATRENYILPLSFIIEHVRWDQDGDKTPFGARWLKLFDPVSVPLALDENGNQIQVDIPVLLKKLVKKPDISVAEPGLGVVEEGDTLDQAINKVRQWTFWFDIERTRAAVQDDLIIDVDYNNRPQDVFSALLRPNDRDIGDVLFEYTLYRQGLLESDNHALWVEALAYWGRHIARGLSQAQHVVDLLDSGNLDRTSQYFKLRETTAQNGKLNIILEKRETWPHSAFEYSLQNIKADKSEEDVLEFDGVTSNHIPGVEQLASIFIDPPIPDLSVGEYYAGRRVGIGKLDILQFENAWPAVTIQRNATLGDYSNIQTAFVYTTDLIRTGEPLTPFIDVTSPISLVGGEIEEIIQTLFSTVLKIIIDDRDKWPLIDLGWGYDSGQLDNYKREDEGMRVFSKDPIGLFTSRKLSPEFGEEVAIVKESIEAWESRNGGKPNGGRYVFELRIYSRLERVEKPLLRLSDLRWSQP